MRGCRGGVESTNRTDRIDAYELTSVGVSGIRVAVERAEEVGYISRFIAS